MATNVVEIAIQAKDQASQQIQAIASGFKSVEIATNAARGSLQLFGSAAIASGTGGLAGLKDAIQSVRKAWSGAVM